MSTHIALIRDLKGPDMRVPLLLIASLVLFFCTSTAQTAPQTEPATQLPDASQPDGSISVQQFPAEKTPADPARERVERQLEKERQKQRWREIKRRSEQLLETATELKQYVDKSGESVLSVEVIRKAQQMEKLSKDLQRMMKGD